MVPILLNLLMVFVQNEVHSRGLTNAFQLERPALDLQFLLKRRAHEESIELLYCRS